MKKALIALSIGMGLSSWAAAQGAQNMGSGLSYDYAELSYIDTEVNDVDGDGLGLSGSYKFSPELVATASYSDLDFNRGIDGSVLAFGLGYVHPYKGRMDLVGYGRIIRQEVEYSNGSDDDDTGVGLAGGVRGLITNELEASALVNYVDVEDSDMFVTLGVDYWFHRNLSAGVSLDIGGDADTLALRGRWYFNN